MSPKVKIAAVVGGAVLLLLAVSGTGNAAPKPKEPVDPIDPKPPIPPKPNVGPHPPPWPGLPTATVKVSGGYTGVRLRSSPSTTAPEVVAYDRGGVYNGRKVAVLEEFVEENGRLWARIYSPTGYEGWSSMVDPQGNRNLWYDGIPDAGQVPVGFVPGERSVEDVHPPDAKPADIAGAHGWYPHARPARVVRPGGQGIAFRPEEAYIGFVQLRRASAPVARATAPGPFAHLPSQDARQRYVDAMRMGLSDAIVSALYTQYADAARREGRAPAPPVVYSQPAHDAAPTGLRGARRTYYATVRTDAETYRARSTGRTGVSLMDGARILPPYALTPNGPTRVDEDVLESGSRVLPRGAQVLIVEGPLTFEVHSTGTFPLAFLMGPNRQTNVLHFYRVEYDGPSRDLRGNPLAAQKIRGWVNGDGLTLPT